MINNTFKILVLLLISFPFTSCVKDLADIDFSTDITESFDVHINQNQEYISQSITLSLDNNDTHDYLDNIKEVSITELTYRVTNFTGDQTGTINVEFASDGSVLLLNDFNVKQANDNGTIYQVTEVSQLNLIANALKNNQQVNFSILGECAALADAMDFKIEVTVKLDVVANPI